MSLGLLASFLLVQAASRQGWSIGELAAAWPLPCPLRFWFGISCPTCGLGRALVATLLGQWGVAWAFNPLGPLLLGIAVPTLALAWIVPQKVAAYHLRCQRFWQSTPWLAYALVGVLLVWAGLRA